MRKKLSVNLLILFFVIIGGCGIPDPVNSAKEIDYFPALQIGSTSIWEFSQATRGSMSSSQSWKGKTLWKVLTVQNAASNRIFTIQRVFSGYSYNYDAYKTPSLDSTIVVADTSYFTINDDGLNITVNLKSNSKLMDYYGSPFTFKRNYPNANETDRALAIDPFIYIIIRKDAGLFLVRYLTGENIGSAYTYTRLQ